MSAEGDPAQGLAPAGAGASQPLKVLVGVDASAASRRAVEYAVGLTRSGRGAA